ncbi:hypothetical protein [Enterococcus sp. AD013-P3]|uniref:hypothetical protein n=1 Tax=Enterococcus sp. AD013-P3 TaxID=3411036 RepID=UPI003B95B6D4
MIVEKKKLYEVYTDYNDDSFFVCYIVSADDSVLAIEKFDRNGEFDGISIVKTDSVLKVNSCTGYLKKYENVEYVDVGNSFTFESDQTIIDILKEMKKSNRLLSLYILDETNIIGKVVDIHTNQDSIIIEMNVYSEDQSGFDGTCLITIDNVQEISMDTKFLRFISNQF